MTSFSDTRHVPQHEAGEPTLPAVPAHRLGLPADLVAEAAAIDARAAEYAERARAANTRRAYRSDWAHFAGWCARYGAQALPADPRLVARYLSAHAAPGPDQLRVVTLQRRLSAIQHVHRATGLDFDGRQRDLREVWRGIRRTHGVASRGKAPTVTEELRALVGTCDPTRLLGLRDRALLLLGFAGCFRRSELVALDVAHVAEHRDGFVVALAWSKTDQEGRGAEKGIPYGAHPETCPVRAVRDWLAASGVREGPLFRAVNRHGHVGAARLSDKAVARVVKQAVAAARDRAVTAGNLALAATFDPARYAGHSLRAGFITSAAAAGVSTLDIMRHSLHQREETLRKYVRHATVFRQNAAAKVGL
jgi:site-specific recombinase XerD